jgi:hypothetical protein
MATPPVHPDPSTCPQVTDHPDTDPTYRSNVNWGSVKVAASSGIQVVYGGPHYGRDPVNGPPKGIGIWKRESPIFRSWDGLLELSLQLIITRWVLSGVTFGLRLPVMGMPPREPSSILIKAARDAKYFFDWFKDANVIPARLLAEFVKIDPKTATMELRGSWRNYNFSTASPRRDADRSSVSDDDKCLDNLYYIQVLRNELPSYHFWSHKDPIQNDGVMRHGLISKGATACYDGNTKDNVIMRTNFNSVQNLPLGPNDEKQSELITEANSTQKSTEESPERSESPRPSAEKTVPGSREEDDPSELSQVARLPSRLAEVLNRPKQKEDEGASEVEVDEKERTQALDDQADEEPAKMKAKKRKHEEVDSGQTEGELSNKKAGRGQQKETLEGQQKETLEGQVQKETKRPKLNKKKQADTVDQRTCRYDLRSRKKKSPSPPSK